MEERVFVEARSKQEVPLGAGTLGLDLVVFQGALRDRTQTLTQTLAAHNIDLHTPFPSGRAHTRRQARAPGTWVQPSSKGNVSTSAGTCGEPVCIDRRERILVFSRYLTSLCYFLDYSPSGSYLFFTPQHTRRYMSSDVWTCGVEDEVKRSPQHGTERYDHTIR